MQMKAVSSTNLSEVGYDEAQQQLVVTFKSGGKWRYDNVTPSEYEALMNAPSIGSHFHTHIKSSKPATRA